MVISFRVLLTLLFLLCVLGFAASSGPLLKKLHVRAGCTSTLVDGNQLEHCHGGWWKPSPDLQPLGCADVGPALWSCPAGIKP
ncbi:MAG TPA: hypothetical protein VGH52_07465 [Gaiellaceae bacterium]|jgi:hypothetical protein